MKPIYNKILPLLSIFMLSSCQGQDNPTYLGLNYGSFDINKTNFSENVENLFSKIPHVDIEKNINGRKMKVYRVKTEAQDNKLFNYFNTKDGDIEFYVDDHKKLVMIFNRVKVTEQEATKFINTIKEKYKDYQLPSTTNRFIDNVMIAKVDNKLLYITQSCMKEGSYKGDCIISYNIYAYPQKDEDILRFLTPINEIREILKK